MLKKLLFTSVFIVVFVYHAFTQAITKDGKYVWTVVNKTANRTKPVLVIQSTISNWKREVTDVGSAIFTANNQSALYMKNDNLFMQELGGMQLESVPGIISFKLPKEDKSEWVAYQLKSDKKLIIKNLISKKRIDFADVTEYSFANDRASSVIIKIQSGSNAKLVWINLIDFKTTTVWEGHEYQVGKFIVNNTGDQICFVVNHNVTKITQILTCSKNDSYAKLVIDDKSDGIDTLYKINGERLSFLNESNRVLFYLEEKKVQDIKSSKEDLWSYTDAKLQSLQLKDATIPKKIAACVDLFNKKIAVIEHENETLVYGRFYGGALDPQIRKDYALVYHFGGDILTGDRGSGAGQYNDLGLLESYSMNEFNWNKAANCSVYLVSLIGMPPILIKGSIVPSGAFFPYFRFSPDGKYLIYYDSNERNYFSFDLITHELKNLTGSVKVNWEKQDITNSNRGFRQVEGCLKWNENYQSFYTYDHFGDVWNIRLDGITKPINITGGYARKNKLHFQILNDGLNLIPSDEVYLTAYDDVDTYHTNGLFKTGLLNTKAPDVLIPVGSKFNYSDFQKAQNSKVFLIYRENQFQPKMAMITRNFKDFQPVDDGQPEKRIAISKELAVYKTFTGTTEWGMLYKPLNFNPKRKYPVLIWYYEKSSPLGPSKLETFEWYNDNGCIPGADLDTGYVYFVPKISFTLGDTGPNAYNCVVSGAEYIKKLPFVDGKHMAIKGQSFSGYETNYIITHTNIFAAATACCGVSDFVSYAGSEDKDYAGFSYSSAVEIGQSRLGTNLWRRPDIYIKNSPIFYADRVTTPLFLTANLDDYRVPFSQNVEMFKALRRLGKQVWLLAGENNGHGDAPNYSVYLKQFLNHYLKGAPPAKWMTQGIPARKKGIDNGLDLDYEIKTPGSGLLLDNEASTPQQQKLLRHKTMVTDDGRIINVLNRKQQKQPKKTIKK